MTVFENTPMGIFLQEERAGLLDLVAGEQKGVRKGEEGRCSVGLLKQVSIRLTELSPHNALQLNFV